MRTSSSIVFLRLSVFMVALIATGCAGPLTHVFVTRLSEEQQADVEAAWDNLVVESEAAAEEGDRYLLLDCIIEAQLHQLGVDTLQMTSEKVVGDGVIVMEVSFDRELPEEDAFSVTLYDHADREVWREVYTGDEARQRTEWLSRPIIVTEDMTPEQIAAAEARIATREARKEQIQRVLRPMLDQPEEQIEQVEVIEE